VINVADWDIGHFPATQENAQVGTVYATVEIKVSSGILAIIRNAVLIFIRFTIQYFTGIWNAVTIAVWLA
jgi:hypothetical protein